MGTSVVVVLNDRKRMQQLRDRLADLQPPLLQLEAIGPGEQTLAEVARLNPPLQSSAHRGLPAEPDRPSAAAGWGC